MSCVMTAARCRWRSCSYLFGRGLWHRGVTTSITLCNAPPLKGLRRVPPVEMPPSEPVEMLGGGRSTGGERLVDGADRSP
jgi:hypothetical protein